MAILRSNNYQGQMRIDVPFLRMIDSGIAADFDLLAGNMLSGQKPLIFKGFNISTANTIGTAASTLKLNVAGGILIHYLASESGSIFSVPDTQAAETLNSTNSKVTGSFVAGLTNYIGLDLSKSADSTTSDLVEFLDADTLEEVPQVTPLGRTMQYRIVISTQNFISSSNILPIAKVVTDSNNNVVSITDARNMMFRLGNGGDVPNALHTYPWGSRTENNIVFTGGSDSFTGEDKSITNLKDWIDAILTSIWEVRGGEYWYKPTNRDNVKLAYSSPTLASNNDNFDFNGTNLTWRSLSVLFENSAVYYNTITDELVGQAFPDGSALYVDVDRASTATLTAQIAPLITVGTSTIPGRRLILAWRKGSSIYTRDRNYEVNRVIPVATTSSDGIVRLNNTPGSTSHPVVVSIMSNGQAQIAATAASNSFAFQGTGDGTGAGLIGLGGASGYGVQGTGGASGAYGGYFTGGGTGSLSSGVVGNGGGNGGTGVMGFGNGGAAGGYFQGGSAGPGATFQSGATDWHGGEGLGLGVGAGLIGLGDSAVAPTNVGEGVLGVGRLTSTAPGVKGIGGSSGGIGVLGLGKVGGAGIQGTADTTGAGAVGVGGSVSGVGVLGLGNGASAPSMSKEGILGVGGASNVGVRGVGSAAGSSGVFGEGTGTGAGILGAADGNSAPAQNGEGVLAIGSTSGSGYGGRFIAGVAATNTTPKNAIVADSGYIGFSGAPNPDSNVGFTSTLTPANICKAWAKITFNGTASPTVNDAFNISSVTASTGILTLNFASGNFANTNYVPVIIMGSFGNPVLPKVSTQSLGSCNFAFDQLNPGGTQTVVDPVNGTWNGLSVYITIQGRQ